MMTAFTPVSVEGMKSAVQVADAMSIQQARSVIDGLKSSGRHRDLEAIIASADDIDRQQTAFNSWLDATHVVLQDAVFAVDPSARRDKDAWTRVVHAALIKVNEMERSAVGV